MSPYIFHRRGVFNRTPFLSLEELDMDKPVLPVLLDDVCIKPMQYNIKQGRWYKGGKNNRAIMLRELIDRDSVTTEQFLDAIYPIDGEDPPDNMNKIIHINIYHLRKKLKDGWEILSVSWNRYRLVYKPDINLYRGNYYCPVMNAKRQKWRTERKENVLV